MERIANQPGLVVTLDLGWLPGPLSHASGQGYHIERTTDVFDGYAPSTRLIAGKLADAQMRWPDATRRFVCTYAIRTTAVWQTTASSTRCAMDGRDDRPRAHRRYPRRRSGVPDGGHRRKR